MRRIAIGAISAASLLVLGACSLANEETKDDDEEATPGSTVVLVTHDSFDLPKKLIRQFETESGLDLEIRASGDGGELTNKLVLSQGNPLGDVAFGVDNTFASRALDNDVFAEADVDLPEGADELVVPGGDGRIAPIDQGSVCVNVDTAWFADHDLEPPATFEDLADPAYEDLFVIPGATTSTPGLAFLLATIDAYGDEWPDYWDSLMDNGAKLVSGWETAYGVDFTAGWGKNPTRPIVVSYDSSPAFTVDDSGETTTAALLDTCFRQVEYAGVLENAENPAGAREVVEWLLSSEVQAVLPTKMYVFPVDPDVALPTEWAAHAIQPTDPHVVDPDDIDDNREEWLTEWTDVTTR
jgi:thiamine transport system substrate-binding protein